MGPNYYSDTKIDYANYLKGKNEETDPEKRERMQMRVLKALREVSPHVGKGSTLTCYADGTCAVSYCDRVFGVYDINTEKWFSGYVGDKP